MSDECIHGFPVELCATCSPKPVPEPVRVARPAARRRADASTRSSSRVARSVPGAAARAVSAGTLLEQRIYHLTHRSNLPSIFAQGALIADATPELELSPPDARRERGEIEFAGSDDRRLAAYVPFFLSPEAQLWHELRAGRAHPRLSSAAREADVFDFVFLVSTIGRVLAAESAFALADGNAEGNTTRFASTREDAERMLYRLRASEVDSAVQNAEFLVADSLPLESVTLIGVANDRARQGVRDQLTESGFTPKISVYPPWFQQTE